MALAVGSYTEVANYETAAGTSKTITGLSWAAGDAIVVVCLTYDGTVTVASVANPNLTFTKQPAAETGAGAESYAYIYSAIAASAQTGQTVTINYAGVTTIRAGGSVYVITGSPSGFANASAQQTETAFSKTVSAGSWCVYAHAEFNATSGKTITTGSGTATERHDAGINYGRYIGDWGPVAAGTFSFGISSYAGTKVGEVFIEVLAPASTVNSGFFSLMGGP